MKSTKLFAAGILLCAMSALPAQDRISLPTQLVGPMVGHVTPSEAIIWMVAKDAPEVIVRYRATSDSADRQQAIRPQPDADAHNVIKARLTGLKPSTQYEYEVLVGGRTRRAWNGGFSTPPPDGRALQFSMAVSSCMKYQSDPIQPSWYLLLAQKPQLQLLLGENVYADTTDRERLWAMHLEQRRVVEFAAVLRNVPTYAMWDDHDYGPNNSDGTAPGKQESLTSFGELFANPAAGTDDTPGAFYRFHWGDVEFFALDGRYHRSPDKAPNDDRKRMLGDEQFKWLADGLRASNAKFKVLASGSTLRASTADGWRIYDFARNKLYQTIRDNKISGVIYLSGDVHRCQLDVHPSGETGGYPLYEVISSGIANSETNGFAILDFDTTQRDPTIRIRMIHGDATTPLDRTVKLSELQVP